MTSSENWTQFRRMRYDSWRPDYTSIDMTQPLNSSGDIESSVPSPLVFAPIHASVLSPQRFDVSIPFCLASADCRALSLAKNINSQKSNTKNILQFIFLRWLCSDALWGSHKGRATHAHTHMHTQTDTYTWIDLAADKLEMSLWTILLTLKEWI